MGSKDGLWHLPNGAHCETHGMDPMCAKKASMKQKAFTVDREYEKVSQLFFFCLT